MTRRRILVATAVALLAAGTAGAATATADTAPAPVPSSGVRTASGDYIACVGLETVNVATCVESPTRIIVELLRDR